MSRPVGFLLAGLFVASLFVALVAAPWGRQEFCDLGLPLQYAADVDGWSWAKDRGHDCEWYLRRNGLSAPVWVYLANGESVPRNAIFVTVLPLVILFGAGTGVVWPFHRSQNRREGSNS